MISIETKATNTRQNLSYSRTEAGCAEFGERHGGFVVEAPGDEHDPFLVCCTDDPDLDRHTETSSSWPMPGPCGDRDRWRRGWPSHMAWRSPAEGAAAVARTMAEDWLRSLTITAEPGTTPEQAVELIARVNQPRSLSMQIRTPLPPDDAQALDETLAWYAEVRSRQAGLNLLLEGLLLGWLAEATGQDRSAVIQRLALAVENLLPPE